MKLVRLRKGLCRRLKRQDIPPLDAGAIGRRVRELRRKRGWRQCDLAEKTGIDGSVIAYIELGRRLPSRDCAIALAVAFRRSLEHILFGLERNARFWNLAERQP